jgi:hypothetical protein
MSADPILGTAALPRWTARTFRQRGRHMASSPQSGDEDVAACRPSTRIIDLKAVAHCPG